MEDFVIGYWGKARPRDVAAPEWHPLSYHCLDVAAAGEALLDNRPQYLEALAAAARLDTDLARRWFLFALALHDIGKFADCFQRKWQHLLPCTMAHAPEDDPGHGAVGRALWSCNCDLEIPLGAGGFRALLQNGHPRTAFARGFNVWLGAVFGHHGRPVSKPGNLGKLMSGKAADDARRHVEACAAIFKPGAPPTATSPDDPDFRRSSWLVAGLSVIADWIGSNQDKDWFPYLSPERSLDAYWPIAQERARRAILYAGLGSPPVTPSFGLRHAIAASGVEEPTPTPLQAWMGEQFHPNGQALVVMEDLTGSGKTEAALIGAHRLMQAGAAEGLYWALPTMATANSLYTRLSAAYRSLFADFSDASLVLAHGKRDFNNPFMKTILPGATSEEPRGKKFDDETASAQCAAWIADDRRKAFLADVGVGTIDQALLGILPAKHQAIRIAALARRVLIIDEVHSYDAYTGTLLQRLLEFHAANGGSAVLLSATMTQALRRKLIAAFGKGARWLPVRGGEPRAAAFPLITIASCAGLNEHPLNDRNTASRRGTRRDLRVKRIADEGAARAILLASHRRREASVWIRNTVHDAISAYRALRAELGDKVELFHARFALGDRMDREASALEAFGKQASERRNRVLVASQVVEQALDLDFDTMVTDLAPIDLLIQRAGRLHRHDRGTRTAPALHVLSPEPVPDASQKWFATMFPKGQYVYADHGQLWLTMRYLIDAGGLKLETGSPRDPIEAVFSENGMVPANLQNVSQRALGTELATAGQARLNSLELANGYAGSFGAWLSDTITPTRLGSPQRLLRLARWDGKQLTPWYGDGNARVAWRLSEVQVLAARVAGLTDRPPMLKRAIDELVTSWGEKFDPPLVVPLIEDGDVWRATAVDAGGHPVAISYSPDVGLELS